jgi:hypothetical protein
MGQCLLESADEYEVAVSCRNWIANYYLRIVFFIHTGLRAADKKKKAIPVTGRGGP